MAGVNRTVAGINADDEDYESEEEAGPANKNDSAKKAVKTSVEQPSHMPRIAGTTMKDLPKVDRGGIPKPVTNNLMQMSDLPYDTMRASGRDFRINANSSKTSFGGESNTAKPIPNRLPK